jgi:gamma-glutamyltranspeptidase/glutathione hydrolase
MVVAPQPWAAEEALKALRRGGNAVDAVVVGAFTQGTVDPPMCGIGGVGTMTIYEAASGRVRVLDFYGRAGARATPAMWAPLFLKEAQDKYGYLVQGDVNEIGHASVATPGEVRGLADALTTCGTWTFRDAIRQCIKYAQAGFRVPAYLRASWDMPVGEAGITPLRRLTATPRCAEIYARNGRLLEIGEMLFQDEMARTLARIFTEGPEDFYEGKIAEAIAGDLESHGGHVTLDDLKKYRTVEAEPVIGSYRGYTIASSPPPGGGVCLVEMLHILEGFDLAGMGYLTPEYIETLAETMRWAFEDRARYLGDPAFVEVPVARLTSPEHAAEIRRRIQAGERPAAPAAAAPDAASTTAISVVDEAGNCVTMTHTLGSGSGVVTPGLGFQYNNYMNCFDPRPGRANAIAPGKSRITMMSSTVVLKASRPVMVVSAPGGTRIVNAVLQTLLNLIDHGMSPADAVAAPRVDFQGEVLEAEARVPQETLVAVERLGYRVNRRAHNYDGYFARPQLIVLDPETGILRGASDPRKDGGVALALE